MVFALAGLSHEPHALISPPDGCSTSCKRSTQDDRRVDLDQAVLDENAKSAPRKVDFLKSGIPQEMRLTKGRIRRFPGLETPIRQVRNGRS